MTLPESTLERLESIDMDRARAIVKLTDAAMPLDSTAQKKIDIVEVAPGLGIIIVGPSRLLQKVHGLRLVEVAPRAEAKPLDVEPAQGAVTLALAELRGGASLPKYIG